MGFLDKAKQEKQQLLDHQKKMRALRQQIYTQYNGIVTKFLRELGQEVWGTSFLGYKYHVDKVELGKQFDTEAGIWGWYVGKGQRGNKSVPYGLEKSQEPAEAYAVLISAHDDNPRFAVVYSDFEGVKVLFTPDLLQENLQIALEEAFKWNPVRFESVAVNPALRMTLISAETRQATELMEEALKNMIETETKKKSVQTRIDNPSRIPPLLRQCHLKV